MLEEFQKRKLTAPPASRPLNTMPPPEFPGSQRPSGDRDYRSSRAGGDDGYRDREHGSRGGHDRGGHSRPESVFLSFT